MDRDLLRQCLSYHGQSLFALLGSEQSENAHFRLISADLAKAPCQRKDKNTDSSAVEQFIARKADLLFSPTWKSAVPAEEEWSEETEEAYAIMPPLEQFMDVHFEERRDLFYRDVERGDVVIGRINSIRDFGFFITLICMGGGLEREIEDLELTALCPIREVPSNGNHDDPLSYYQMGDLIRAGVKDIDRYHGKLTVSLHPSSLSPNLAKLKLGVISAEEMPLHYSRGLKVASSSSETYQKVLESSLGFSNPSNVEFLLGKLGISETQPPSLMRGLQSKNFSDEDYGTSIRKKQSASWALKCVKIGVDHFKSGRHVEAMNEYNKALEMDPDNVEALVARGALYATKGSLVKAMDDFELALKSCPSHRNAKKYLCQTLVERGGRLEEEEKLVTAESLYRKALALDENFKEAEDALQRLQVHIQKSLKLREEEAAKEQKKSKNVETSAEKLRKILKEEKRMKRKKRRSSSSSSSSSTSSSTSRDSSSSSGGRRKSKKRKRKGRRSSRNRKKRHRRVSSHDRSVGSKEEWYPAPANTSASFINEKQEVSRLLDEQSWPEGCGTSQVQRRRSRPSVSSSSLGGQDDSRGRFEDDPFDGPSQQTDHCRGRGDGCLVSPSGSEAGLRERKWSCGERVQRKESSSRHQEQDSLGKMRNKRYSSSSVGSEPSRRADSHTDGHSAQSGSCRRSDGSRYDNRGATNQKGEPRDKRYSDECDPRASGDTSQNGKVSSEGSVRKNVPATLLDIFSQIAQFEKEKLNKAKM
ncbi:tetratricopeptide repeat protein 14 isoform X2 [Scleropages formosus]|uniref:Tetratricopeptide repeat domain 14 n=2 Tax=Scleropages formosus TaxID=113540 RepID=A0A8C9RBV3_SCLFO|nr:tetratricopeptide repeat protein 14 isoform X2 [Scleropages formosus]